jgi:hypothetical protein
MTRFGTQGSVWSQPTFSANAGRSHPLSAKLTISLLLEIGRAKWPHEPALGLAEIRATIKK